MHIVSRPIGDFTTMLSATILLMTLVEIGGPTPATRYIPRRIERSCNKECINPNVLANRDVVHAARFDSFGSVAMQREAARVGSEKFKAASDYWKATRAINSVQVAGGWQQQAQQSFQRQDQFQHKP
jgi:hypothetical protein